MTTVNDIYGLAKNPYDIKRSCGGSSGGEGGLIAARCSPLGLGTDIGGSIRTPANFCGTFGFKPTPSRVAYDGHILPVPDGICPQYIIKSVMGPLANSTNDIKLAMEVLFRSHEIDITVPALPFNETTYQDIVLNKNLRIGYFDELPLIPTSKSVKRAIKLVKSKLEEKGYILVPFKISEED